MPSFPFYPQPDSMDCGPTCLRMVAAFYKKEWPLSYLREQCRIGKEGVSLLGISEGAEAIGFRTQAVQLDLQTLLREATLPAILHWKQKHFIILYRVSKKKLFLADPAKGLLTLTAEEFRSHWISDKKDGVEEGIALLLEPGPGFYSHTPGSPETATGKDISLLAAYLEPYRKLLFQLFTGLAVGSLLQLLLPFLTQSVVDTGINTANLHFVTIVLLAQLALFTGRMAVEFVRSWILLHISTRINISILTDFLIRLMKLPVPFFDTRHTGDILQRMNDHSRIESFLTGSSLNTLFALVNLLVFSVVLVLFSPSIFAVFVMASLLYAGWILILLNKRKQLDHRRFALAAREQSAAIQLVQGMQEIKLNGVETSMRWGWERLQAGLFRLGNKSLSLNQWQQAGALFINEGKNIFITFLSARAVIAGEMSLGSMLAIQYMIGQLNSPVEQMIGLVQSWQQARISLGRLKEIQLLEPEEKEGNEKLQHFAFGPSSFLHFRQLSFTYPGAGNEPVLKAIDLSLPIGKTTAIVGVSGSGKTTLLKLLLKFYEPQSGSIFLGNTPLSAFSHRSWRSHCGVVMQESFIFSDSIARNIAVGDAPINRERLHYAATTANVLDFIQSLPLGFNTRIGAEGTGISMGQRQRLLIARAVYRDPQFIFLDEATNSLDANNESTIVHNLRQFFTNRTVLVVAHRLSTVRHADQIVVLHRGAVAECGTHEELVRLKKEYYTLVKNQLELGL
jgi:ATP-binding cassette subfamily B protein